MLRLPALPKWVLRLVKWIFLLTLPLTIFPIFNGLLHGFLFPYWTMQHIDRATNTFFDETKDIMSDWGVGGNAPTFRQYLDTHNDFHLMRVNTNDWLGKLGFILPSEYMAMADPNTGIDKCADLVTLMRDTSRRSCARKPREQWLYLSDFAFPSINKWDAAFDEVLQYRHAHSKLNQTRFYHANCGDSAGFLCGVWATRSPALVHFKVEDDPPKLEDIEQGLTYRAPLRYLRPVTVRIIEFPLKDAFTALPASTFPSFKQQMLSIVAGDNLYEQFEPYDSWSQMVKRFDEYMDTLLDAPGTWLNRFNKADTWIDDHVAEPLGLTPYVTGITQVMFTISSLVSALTGALYRNILFQFKEFLGRPRLGDEALAGFVEDEDAEDRFWKDFKASLNTFADNAKRRKAAERSSQGSSDTSMSITAA